MRPSLLPIGLVLLGAIVIFAGAEYSSRSAACMVCHRQEASFTNWMIDKTREEKKGFAHEMIACADCHIEGKPEQTMVSRFRSLLHTISYFVPQIDPRLKGTSGLFDRTRVPSQNCQYCHYASVYRKSVYLKDLPEGLKSIGLVMDHRKHVLARENTCSRCHERFKTQDDPIADKGVNYAEVNHMACDACHSYASHSYRKGRILPMSETEYGGARKIAWEGLATNPRWMIAIPSEKTCRRCHNGQIHYKTRIFMADCRTGANYDNCVKCHPLMTRSFFEKYLRGKGRAASANQAEIVSGTVMAGQNLNDIVTGSDQTTIEIGTVGQESVKRASRTSGAD